MSWKLISRPKTQKVTKALAKQFAEMDAAPHDRPLSERRLQVYTRLLNEGQFRPVAWTLATCRETGGTYRINGKHTSVMLSNLEDIPEFYVTIEEYSCDTLEDVARLYATVRQQDDGPNGQRHQRQLRRYDSRTLHAAQEHDQCRRLRHVLSPMARRQMGTTARRAGRITPGTSGFRRVAVGTAAR